VALGPRAPSAAGCFGGDRAGFRRGRRDRLDLGHRWVDGLPKTYDVGSVLLARPFRPVRVGPVSQFVEDLAAERFYTDRLGLVKSEEATIEGHRAVFLRANTEHHSIGLFPLELRRALGAGDHSTLLAFGVQVGSYEQLRAAKTFLENRGVKLDTAGQEHSSA
jgi:hypothetical protein